MHTFSIPQDLMKRVADRVGRTHPFDEIVAGRTALVVVDMQNYFVKQGFMGEVPMAREIVPGINRLARAVRGAGGHVVWIKNSTNDTLQSWSVYHQHLLSPTAQKVRYDSMTEGNEGHELWAALEPQAGDVEIIKKRFSAFIQGSSDLPEHLRKRGIDTVLVAGTATNVCCESTARDAMMLNFKTVMVSDANATFTDEEHAASLCAFYSIFGDVQTIDEAIQSMQRGRQASAA